MADRDPPLTPEPFRLEPEEEKPAAPRTPPLPPRQPAPVAPDEDEAGPSTTAVVRALDGTEREVSTATVRERQDPDARTRPGLLPLPPGWPREALAYPFRDRRAIAVGASAWVVADALYAWNAFIGALAQIVLAALLIRWAVRCAARTGTGDDVPAKPFGGIAIDREDFAWFGFLLLYAVPTVIPLLAPYLREPANPIRTPGETAMLWVFLGVTLVVAAPALVIGAATDDRRLARPWVAARWFARGPALFVAFAIAWGAFLAGQWGVMRVNAHGLAATVIVSVLARTVTIAGLLAAARGLGVVVRRAPV